MNTVPGMIFLLGVLAAAAPQTQSVRFYVIRQWKYINFTWPSEDALKSAAETGSYVPENVIVSGVKFYDDHFYVTLPRMKGGVPATLTRIPAGHVQDYSPALEPFPSWEMNDVRDCGNLQNVQNVEIDAKGQMWIIDGGRVETLLNPVVKCAPKLVIYDVKEKRVNTVYHFPEEVAAKNGSFLYDLVVDNTDEGYAYITDNSGHDPGIIVYSVKENRSWKIRDSKTMSADPSATQFAVNNVSISTPINIAGIALGPKIHTSNDKVVVNEDRDVYFSPLSSLHLYAINTTILRNGNLARAAGNFDDSIKDVGLKPSQTVGMVMDNQGILYYNLLGNNAIGRWDVHTPFQSGQRLIARDRKYLEWPNSFTFDKSGNLTVLTNRLNEFIFGKMDLNEYNFRLISSFVGGASYLSDDQFSYDTHGHHGTEPAPTPEPKPEPEPAPNAEPVPEHQQDDHTHMNDHGDHAHMSGHDHHDDDVTTPPRSLGSSLVVSFLVVFVGVFVVLA